MTTADGIFVAGDLQTGPRLIIDAIASGKKAARSILKYRTGKIVTFDATELHVDIEDYDREKGYETIKRVEIETLSPTLRRDMARVVERGYGEDDALREASRCLDCGVNTIFNGDRCVLCGGCADVCPELCLKLVSLDRIDQDDESLRKLISNGLGDIDAASAAMIIKDEARCIRCGLCASRCPADAITMERFCFRERART